MIPFVKSPYFQSRQGQKIVGIVLHTMVGSYKGTISYFQSNASQVSAHYCIDLNGDTTQMVDEKDAANHAGIVSVPTFKQTVDRPGINPNWYTIGIEHADNSDPAGADRKNQYPASIQLVVDLCKRYSIPCDREHICGHREIRSTKSCPGNFDVDYVVREAQKILSPQPTTDVPQALSRYGKGSLADLIVYIDLLREDSANLTTEKTISSERLSLIQDIATKLACSTEPGMIKAELDILLQVETSSQEAQDKLKKTIEQKDQEIVQLNNNLKILQAEIAQLKADHMKQIETMQARVDSAITQKTQAETQKQQLSFIQQLFRLFKKG